MKKIVKIWLTDSEIWIEDEGGNKASEKFADYPRLRGASLEQLKNFTSDDYGLRWEDLDEDLSFDGFFRKKPENILYRIFMEHPELNASAVARRMGISQSLFAQYISGTKVPSEKRMLEIMTTIQNIGRELLAIIPEPSSSIVYKGA